MQKRRKYFSSYKVTAYLITILISLAILGLISYFIIDAYLFKDVMSKKSPENKKEVSVTKEIKESTTLNVLFGFEDNKKLQSLMLIKFDSKRNEIFCVPVSTDTRAQVDTTNGTISDFYKSSGLKGVCSAVENALDVDVQRYILLDRDAIEYLVDKLGGVYYTVPFEIKYTDSKTKETATFSPKDTKRLLKGEDVRKIVLYPFPESKISQKPEFMASLCVNIINQSVKTKDRIINDLDNTFRELSEKSKTDMTFEDYSTRKKGLVTIISNSNKPATFCIPKGKWNENAQYVIDSQSKNELNKYLNPS